MRIEKDVSYLDEHQPIVDPGTKPLIKMVSRRPTVQTKLQNISNIKQTIVHNNEKS